MPKTSPRMSAATTTNAAAAIAISLTEVLLPSAVLAAAPPERVAAVAFLPFVEAVAVAADFFAAGLVCDLTDPVLCAPVPVEPAVGFCELAADGRDCAEVGAGFFAAELDVDVATGFLAAELDATVVEGFFAAPSVGLTAVRACGCLSARSLGLCGAVAGLAELAVAGFRVAELGVAELGVAVGAGFLAVELDVDVAAGFFAAGAAVGLTVERVGFLSSDRISAISTSL